MALIDSIIDLTPLTSSLNSMGDDVKDMKERIAKLEEQNRILLSQNQSILQSFEDLRRSIERQTSSINSSIASVSSNSSKGTVSSVEETEPTKTFVPQNIYFGSPQSLGFAIADEINSIDSPKALYEVCVNSEDSATFHVLTSKYPRLQLNVASLLTPVCQVEGEAESSSQIVVIADGELQKKEKMWCVVKPCVVKFQ